MGRIQQRLTYFERQQIEFYLRCHQKIRKIAELLHRDHSVISREVRRNGSPWFPYSAVIAQKAANRRSHYTNSLKLLKDELLREDVERKLQEGWSPEQITGRLKRYPPSHLQNKSISHEAVYQYIYNDKKGAPWLYHKLRRAHPLRQRRYSRKSRKVMIPDRTPIELRPEEINQRQRYGDWESDTMEFQRKRQGFVSVQRERKFHLLRLTKIDTKKAEETKEALSHTIESLPQGLVKTITLDNGGEGAKHTELKENYKIQTFFCRAYAAWQKGSVENTIGLLRQYLPKKTDIEELTPYELQEIQEKVNNRPRKSLNYQTPNEILEQITKNGALNS